MHLCCAIYVEFGAKYEPANRSQPEAFHAADTSQLMNRGNKPFILNAHHPIACPHIVSITIAEWGLTPKYGGAVTILIQHVFRAGTVIFSDILSKY